MDGYQAIITLLGALVVAGGTLLGIRWRSGGTVRSSEAGDLWAANKDLHDRLEEEIKRRDADIQRMSLELSAARDGERLCIRRTWRLERALNQAGIPIPD